MNALRWLGSLSIALALVSACSSDSSTPSGTGGGTTTQGSDLPCEVAAIVERSCLGCHGSPVRSGAPWPLLTLSSWQASSLEYEGLTNGEVSVARMLDPNFPMPPEGLLTSEEIAVVSTWVDAGMPGGDCLPATPADGPLDAAATCTSGDFWPAPAHHATGKPDEEMFPGMPCLDCHANPADYGQPEPGPGYDAAGTVFPTAHEPDNCAGIDPVSFAGVIVRIVDANGTLFDLQPNAAGNFLLDNSGMTPPYSAMVIHGESVRAMSLKPTSGDCNLCHSDNGSAGPDPDGPIAPGRIVIPAASP